MIDNGKPYAKQAAALEDLLIEYQHQKKKRNLSQADLAKVFGVKSPSTVGYWLNGIKKPQRMQAIRIAKGLELADPFLIARWYGYVELSDDSPASIPELIDFVEKYDQWGKEYKAVVISRLELAADPPNRFDRETIADMLQKRYPLVQRAQRIAEFADMATSHPLLNVA